MKSVQSSIHVRMLESKVVAVSSYCAMPSLKPCYKSLYRANYLQSKLGF